MNLSTYETRRTWLPKTGSPLSADPKTASPRRRHDQIEDANGDKQEPHGAVTGLVWLGNFPRKPWKPWGLTMLKHEAC